MNKLKYLLYLAFAGLMLPFTSCEDPDLNPYLEPETAVHGLGAFSSGSPTSFKVGDMNTPVKFDLQWVSIDSKNTVTKMEVFVTYTEKYIDPERNPRTANHGTKRIVTIEGSNVPANRKAASFTISPAQVYELFKANKFNYGTGSVDVFANAARTAASRFTANDGFRITWAFTTADGRFFDSWSDSVCLEFPGANCSLSWTAK